jgi:hypothetical protein
MEEDECEEKREEKRRKKRRREEEEEGGNRGMKEWEMLAGEEDGRMGETRCTPVYTPFVSSTKERRVDSSLERWCARATVLKAGALRLCGIFW